MGYRLQDVANNFIGGGRLADYSVSGKFTPFPELTVSGFLQYEQWQFPELDPRGQSNTTASVQVTYYPHWRRGR
jgi:hypothetical protein